MRIEFLTGKLLNKDDLVGKLAYGWKNQARVSEDVILTYTVGALDSPKRGTLLTCEGYSCKEILCSTLRSGWDIYAVHEDCIQLRDGSNIEYLLESLKGSGGL